MVRHEFNERCARFLGIFSSNVGRVFVVNEGEMMPREYDPYYDACDREKIIAAMCIDTMYLRDMDKPEWQCIYGSGGDIVIETGETIADAQVACITSVLMQA